MAELALSFGLSGRDIDARLRQLGLRLADVTAPLEAAGRRMLGSVAQNFAARGRPESWPPLAGPTVRARGSDAPLVRTGALMGSVGFTAGPDRMEVRADVPYAAVQQQGGHGIPARPFLVFQAEDVEGITRLVGEYLMAGNGGW